MHRGHMQPARAEGYARIKMQIPSPCNHEEAYSTVIIHAFDAGRKGRQKLLIRTVDTDILVLAIAYVERFDAQERFLCLMHSQNAIRCRYLQENAKQNCVSIALFQSQQHHIHKSCT